MANIGMMPSMLDVQLAVPPPQSPVKACSGTAKTKDGFSGALNSALNSGKSDEPAKQLPNAKDAGNVDKACETDNTGANQMAACAAGVQPQQNLAVPSGQQGSNEGQKVDNVAVIIPFNRQTSVLSAGITPMAQLNLQTATLAKAEQSDQTLVSDVKSGLEQGGANKMILPQSTLADTTEGSAGSKLTSPTSGNLPETVPGVLSGADASKSAAQSVVPAKDGLAAIAPSDSLAVTNQSSQLTATSQSENKAPDQTLTALNSLLGVKTEVVKTAEDLKSSWPTMPNATAKAAATAKPPVVQNMKPAQLNQSSQVQSGDGENVEPAVAPQQALTPVAAKQQQQGAGLDNSAMLTGEQVDGNSAVKQDETFGNEQSFAAALSQHVVKNEANPAITDTANGKANDPYNIAGQIVEQAKIITTPQNSEMIIKLKPEHLGELTLKIVVDNGTVSASFHSSNPEVRGIIENSLGQLRQEIANQGLKVNYVGVYASLDHFSAKDQRGNQQQQMAKTKTKAGSQDFVEAVESVEANYLSKAANGVDYRI